MKPWERLPEESDLAYAAFAEYLVCAWSVREPCVFSQHLQKNRGLTVSPGSIESWRERHAWKKRSAAYHEHVQSKRLKLIAGSVAKESAKIAIKQAQGRRIALEKTIKSLMKIGQGNDRDADVTQAAIRKAIENIGMCVLDHADQLRKLSSEVGSGLAQESSESEEVIPPIPPEPGSVQYGHPEEEAVLGETAGDMPGDS